MSVVGVERRVRILVIDDDHDSRSWMRQLLEQVGFDVREAGGEAEASAGFDAFRPDLVLLDVHHPVADSYATMRSIRALPAGRRSAIVVITSSTFDEEHDSIVEAGADGVLRKPCREAELLEEIRKQLGIEYSYAEAAPPERVSQVPDFLAMRHTHVLKLPPSLVAELRTAAHVADYDRLKDLLHQLPAEHAAVADVLRELVEQYGYDQIEAILQV
jgi:CheY-like chemotaxis protein